MYYSNRDIRLEEMSVPEIGPDELLVKVISSGICGSDVMEWYRIEKAPIVLGHEIAGEIVRVGESVRRFKTGDRVFVSHHVPCDKCHHCRMGNHTVCDTLRSTNFDPGGFSEYVRVPAINVETGTFIIPDSVTYDEGTFIEPLACVIRGQQKAGIKPGQNVLVIGSGIAGILHIQLARINMAGSIVATDISNYRLEAARTFGADAVFRADEDIETPLKEINRGYLADLVIVCAGAEEAVSRGLKLVERGGTVLLFAPTPPDINFPIALYDFWREGITLTTSYAGSPDDINTAIEMLRDQKINVRDMITHRLRLDQTDQGFRLMAESDDSLKIIIEPHS